MYICIYMYIICSNWRSAFSARLSSFSWAARAAHFLHWVSIAPGFSFCSLMCWVYEIPLIYNIYYIYFISQIFSFCIHSNVTPGCQAYLFIILSFGFPRMFAQLTVIFFSLSLSICVRVCVCLSVWHLALECVPSSGIFYFHNFSFHCVSQLPSSSQPPTLGIWLNHFPQFTARQQLCFCLVSAVPLESAKRFYQ